MKAKDFDGVVENRINLIKSVLASKCKEYAKEDGDRLHNFKRAAETLRTTPEKALIGMFTKHLISILDIVDAVETSVPTVGMVEEKIGDAVNYLVLLEGLLKERTEQDENYTAPPSVEKALDEVLGYDLRKKPTYKYIVEIKEGHTISHITIAEDKRSVVVYCA